MDGPAMRKATQHQFCKDKNFAIYVYLDISALYSHITTCTLISKKRNSHEFMIIFATRSAGMKDHTTAV